ncbi:MAG: hypothetical protein ACRDPG_07265, partial [Nocardioidaceae bacterium]
GDGTISWSSGWVDVALVIFAVMAVLGPTVESGHAKRIQAAAAELPDGPLPADLDRLRRDPVATYVSFFGASQIIAFLYLMTDKPGLAGALLACSVAAAVSVGVSFTRLRSLDPSASTIVSGLPDPSDPAEERART